MRVKGASNNDQWLPQSLSRLLAQGTAEGIFAGVAAGIVYGPPSARRQWQGFYGQRRIVPDPLPLTSETFFDLASLTKPLATSLAFLSLIEQDLLSLDTPLSELLERVIPVDKQNITLRQLLAHSSGLVAHRPYYQKLKEMPVAGRQEEMLARILAEPLAAKPGEKAIYSDLGFMLLGWIAEGKSGLRLDRLVKENIYQPLSCAENIFYRPLDQPWPAEKAVAATEECPWRNKVLEGEVSDDNAHVLGGVAGQAGLFGDLATVLTLVTHLLDCWQERTAHPAFGNQLLKTFLQREGTSGSSWALGFDTPSPQGSSAGRYFHPTSVGHLGYSGTSFWIDPSRDLVVVLLSNRIHPSRQNTMIKQFRPRFHDAVIKFISS